MIFSREVFSFLLRKQLMSLSKENTQLETHRFQCAQQSENQKQRRGRAGGQAHDTAYPLPQEPFL